MIDPTTEICVCNSISAEELAQSIKEQGITSVEELYASEICPVGDKCEACRDEGFNNDGINVPLVFALTQRGQL